MKYVVGQKVRVQIPVDDFYYKLINNTVGVVKKCEVAGVGYRYVVRIRIDYNNEKHYTDLSFKETELFLVSYDQSYMRNSLTENK